MRNAIYINKKTKKKYTMIYIAIDATNSRDGEMVVVYQDESFNVFVREYVEFLQKFERMD